MGKFLADTLRSILSTLVLSALLFVVVYSSVTHEFPPNLGHMRQGLARLQQFTSSDADGKMGDLPNLLAQIKVINQIPILLQAQQERLSALEAQVAAMEAKLALLSSGRPLPVGSSPPQAPAH